MDRTAANEIPVVQQGTDDPVALVTLVWDNASHSINLEVSIWIIGALILLAVGFLVIFNTKLNVLRKDFEIDEAEIGIGDQKFKFKPNATDKQIAYAIWVELSTRKIGIPIDFNDDVIVEIYDSWFNFFSVTRELIKTIPASKLKSRSTKAIVDLSIEVLNQGLRPHLTKWQARFRNWYNRQIKKHDNDDDSEVIDPQDIQQSFPRYEELKSEMEAVNEALIKYRQKMYDLIISN